MELEIDVDVVADELKEWAEKEGTSVSKLIEQIVLHQCKVFLFGKSVGMEQGHARTIEAIKNLNESGLSPDAPQS